MQKNQNIDNNYITKQFYDLNAESFEKNTNNYLTKHLQNEANYFLSLLSGKKILDLGCGPGRDALFFKQQGFHPICIDFSEKMISICKSKNLEAYQMDFENLQFPKNSFDGVWAYTSLMHLPKSSMNSVLSKISLLLKPNGILFTGMKQGNFEGFESNKNYVKDNQRFISLYLDDELKQILQPYFKIISFESKTIDATHTYLHVFCKKIVKIAS